MTLRKATGAALSCRRGLLLASFSAHDCRLLSSQRRKRIRRRRGANQRKTIAQRKERTRKKPLGRKQTANARRRVAAAKMNSQERTRLMVIKGMHSQFWPLGRWRGVIIRVHSSLWCA